MPLAVGLHAAHYQRLATALMLITPLLVLAAMRRGKRASVAAAARAPAKDGATLRPARADGKPPILEGLRVVELGTVVAAPIASRLLCDFGAEVVKVEDVDDLVVGDEEPETQQQPVVPPWKQR